MSRKTIHISNLDHTVETDELQRLFADHGTVRSAEVINQLKTADITGTGFVEMDSEEHCEAAIAALNGVEHRGSPLVVAWAKPGQRNGIDLTRMFESMNIPDGVESHAALGTWRDGLWKTQGRAGDGEV